MMIKRELELAFAAAVREAQQRRHEMLTVEHILYALLYDEMGSRILANCGADIDQLKRRLDEFFTDNIELLPEAAEKEIVQSIGVQRVLQRALMHVQASEKTEVDAGDILASILEEENSHAVFFLKSQNINRLDILHYISHGISADPEPGCPSESCENRQAKARTPSSQ